MARLSTYTKDLNLTGKDMLAGSNYITTVNGIDQFETNNFTLAKITEYINGQIITDPSVLSLKANGGLVYETVNSTNYLAVDLSATNITGQLANSDLANSTITINGTSVALGGSITIGEVSEVIAGTYLNGGGTEGTVTLNHDLTTRTDTTSSISPAHETSFTVIDTLSTNSTGHVTGANTKTVTLPSDTTYTIEAIDSSNDALIRLIGSDSTTDDIKLKAGSNIVINVNESTDEIEIASTAFGNVYTVASEAAMIAATSTAGDLVVRTDVSKTFIHNGGNTGTAADFTELQFSGIQQIDLVEGLGIDLEDHAGNPVTVLTQNANDLKVINTLATSSERGGIQIGYTENGKNYPVELSSEKAYVNVPWEDNYVDSITVTEPTATTKRITLGRTGSLIDLTADFNDNDTTYSAGVGLVLTGTTFKANLIDDTLRSVTAQTITTTSNRTYAVMPDADGDLVVNIPWTDTPANDATITLSAGTYISGGGDFTTDQSANETITFNHDNTTRTDTTSSVSPAHQASFTAIDTITTNATGHITAVNTKTITLPSDNDNNTTYSISAETATGGANLRLTGVNPSSTDDVLYKGSGATTVTRTDADTITISSTDTTNWNFKVDTNVAENISAGETVTFTGTDGIELSQNGNTIDINHADTSSQGSVNNGGNTFIQDVTLDTYGHVTGLTSTAVSIGNGTLTVQGTGALGGSGTFTANQSTNTTISISHDDTSTLNGTYGSTANNTKIDTITVDAYGHVTAVATGPIDDNNSIDYINAASFNTGNGILTLSGVGNAGATVNLDGRYLTSYTETDTLATVTSRGASTTTNTTFSSNLTVSGSQKWLYIIPNAAASAPTHVYGMAMSWNYTNGSRESNIIFAAGSDANASQEADCQVRFQYKPVSGSISTVAKLWSGGNMNIAGYLTVQNGGNTITNAKVGQWDTAYTHSQSAHAPANAEQNVQANWNETNSGSDAFIQNKPTIPTNYLRDDADDTTSGRITAKAYKFNGNDTNPTNTTATIYDQASVGLTASAHNFSIRNYNGSSMVESARFTTSSLTVIGDVVAYGSPSDITLKENIKPIENALDKVEKLQGVTFDWKESDSILNIKEDLGFIAQDVQKVLPELVRKNDNGKLSLRHQGIISVLVEAIKELSDRIKMLEDGSTK